MSTSPNHLHLETPFSERSFFFSFLCFAARRCTSSCLRGSDFCVMCTTQHFQTTVALSVRL
jgi:hypothetical protein